MKKTVLLCCIFTAIVSCGNKSTSTAIEVKDDSQAENIQVKEELTPANPELIAERVSAIYEAVADAYPEINDITPENDKLDDAFCSAEWNTLVQMVNSKDAENIGKGSFFDSDYWVMGQDWGKISISDLKVDIKDNQHANADFILHNLNRATRVTLELIFESGEWLIGNFIDKSHDKDWKKSMMKYLEEKGKKEQEETADDGIIEYDVE